MLAQLSREPQMAVNFVQRDLRKPDKINESCRSLASVKGSYQNMLPGSVQVNGLRITF